MSTDPVEGSHYPGSLGVNLLYLSSCDWDRFSGSVECIQGAVKMAGG